MCCSRWGGGVAAAEYEWSEPVLKIKGNTLVYAEAIKAVYEIADVDFDLSTYRILANEVEVWKSDSLSELNLTSGTYTLEKYVNKGSILKPNRLWEKVKDFTVVVTGNPSTVKLDAASAANVSVKVGSLITGTTLVQGETVSVNPEEEHQIIISLTDTANYISALTITNDAGNTVATLANATAALGSYTYTLATRKVADTYTIKVETKSLFSFEKAVEYNSYLTDGEKMANVKTAMTDDSIVGIIDYVTVTPSENGTTANIAVVYAASDSKYPPLGTVKFEDVPLKDSRPQPEITVISGEELEELNKIYTGELSAEELTEKLFVSLGVPNNTPMTERFNGFEGLNVAPAVDPGSDAEQTVTFTYAENKNYRGANKSVTFKLTPAPTDSNISLVSNEGDASVTLSYGEVANAALTSEARSIPQNTDITITVKPKDGWYLESFTLTHEGEAVAINGNTATFTTGTLKTYTVSVMSKPAKLVLINNDSDNQYINYNDQLDASHAEAEILKLIDNTMSDPVVDAAKGTITVRYDAGNGDWENLSYSPSILEGVVRHAFGEKSTEKVKITFDATDDKYPNTMREFSVTLNDNRIATTIGVKKPQDTITYKVKANLDEILAAICNGVVETESGNAVSGAKVELTHIWLDVVGTTTEIEIGKIKEYLGYDLLKNMDAGDYTVTLSYAGNKNYKASNAKVTFTIERADASIGVNSVVKTYDGKKIDNPIVVTGAAPNQSDKVEYVTAVAGLDINGTSYINVNIPDSYGLSETLGFTSKTVSLDGVANQLNTIFAASDLSSDILNAVKNVINTIAENDQLKNAQVTVSLGQNIMPTDSGVYLIGGIISDRNYKTGAAMNYAVIKPQAAEGKLKFNFEDENFVVLADNLSKYDFSAHIIEDGLNDGQIDWANEHIKYLYIGMTTEDVPYVDDVAPKNTGVYTQIAYIASAANTDMVYAAPIVRPFVVVNEPVAVEFTTEERSFTYNGKQHGLDAKAYSMANGRDMSGEGKLTVYYTGVETDGDIYHTTTTRPTQAGAYNVTAIYVSNDKNKAGITTTTMLITLSGESAITVDEVIHTYDGVAVNVNSLVSSSPKDAARTVITGSVSAVDDVFAKGLDALVGTINVDFPPRVDRILGSQLGSRALAASAVKRTVNSLAASIEDEMDAALIQAAKEILAQIPENANVTFNDNPAYSEIGVYLIFGVITDPNYKPVNDIGYLAITPTGVFEVKEETEVEYDGNEHFIDITKNPSNLPYISVIRDEAGNVNIIFPDSLYSEQLIYSGLQNDINSIRSWLESVLPESVQKTEAHAQLMSILDSVTFDSLEVNGGYPVEPGKYDVICIAYGTKEGILLDRGTLIITMKEVPTPTPTPMPGDDPEGDDPEGDDPTGTDDVIVSDLPQTGDGSQLMLWMALMAAAVIGAMLLRRKASAN